MIIAEIGQNHCGNMDLAKKLIGLAKENGADLVKFQLYDHAKLYKDYPEIPDVALSFDQAKMLFDYGQEIAIEVFFSVFDVERVGWCQEIGVKRYKLACSVASNMIDVFVAVWVTNKPFIRSLLKEMLPTKLSPVRERHLLCVPNYPAQFEDYSGESFLGEDSWDGISDHTIGLDLAKISIARGAYIIEKHFAIDHKTGIDAEWSMIPEELRELKRWERLCQQIL